MVYFAVRPILTDEPAAREIIPLIFYRIWLKASDFNPASGSVLELLKTTARQYAFDRFLSRGFENGGLLSTAHNDPAFDVELMTRVSKTTLDLRPSKGALKEIDNSEDATWDQDDSRAEKLVGALKTKIRAALKALRELPLEAFRPGE
jgi:hypothetical protein